MPVRSTSRLFIACPLAALASVASAQNCQTRFLPAGSGEFIGNGVQGLNVLDAGDGPKLYIGGLFDTINSEPFNKLARFDGAAFQPLAQGLHPFVHNFAGCCSKGFTFSLYDDGSGPAVFVGGDYISTNDLFPVASESIARWRPGPDAFEDVGGLQNAERCRADCPSRVYASLVIPTPTGPALVIAGAFSTLGINTASPVASRYVGMRTPAGWVSMAGGVSVQRTENPEPAYVNALALFDTGAGPRLYAGGHFTHAGGIAADSIARWTGSAWEPLPGGGIGPNGDEPPRGQVNAMTVFNGSLVVGGEFTEAGGLAVSNIALYDGGSWHALGDGVDAQIRTLAVWDDGRGPALYAGGDFTTAGGVDSPHLARWNGSRWESVLGGLDGSPYAMAVFQGELYVGGFFMTAGGTPVTHLARLTNRPCCRADFNNSGSVTVQDIFDFLAAYFSADRRADFNGSGSVTVQDIFDFLAAYFTGCT